MRIFFLKYKRKKLVIMTKLWHPGVLQEEKSLMKESDWKALHEWELLHEKEEKEKKGGDKDD